jgi:leucyl-tRNA---protein transferase
VAVPPESESLAGHTSLKRALAGALEREAPAPGDPFPCPYLSGRAARHVLLKPQPFSPALYHGLMDLNFRRLGHLVYRPACEGCAECRMLRVPVAAFRPTRSQRRALARNRDVSVHVGDPEPSGEKLELYRHYLSARHDGTMDGSSEEFEGFLYSGETHTLEVEYRLGPKLLGVGLVDATPLALSAVYFYFDPAERARSPGVFNVLWLIEETRRRRALWLYLGYYVAGARSMNYKANFGPCEALSPSGFELVSRSGQAP